ncbi:MULTISPECIES: hypothetical protein [Paraburkholderia]|uniref:Uncharacterized protein n=1 Tax=Paraburkholderia madseniana TaxID=2599607 RepID=A0AAP5ESD2_9BURK|nr:MULTISPECIES: hypothetical protein [Paraburkholderia]MCX4150001.1 hypothetical protein [Paraburkholderia madseniana]MDN7152937.1 hypothetical protein [Paraburkholderia sp. WS6]MDQ6411819.1 hypothetical protein [Paraburkholderia madseniana]
MEQPPTFAREQHRRDSSMNAEQARYDRQCRYDRLHQMNRLRDVGRLPRPIDIVDLRGMHDCRRILNGDAVLPRCVDLADSAYLAKLDQFEAEEAERSGKGYYVPDWATYTKIATVANMTEAMDRYYKSERLNRPDGTRDRLIASNQEEYDAKGFACIASYHDSVNGHSIYVRQAEHGIDIYSSNYA